MKSAPPSSSAFPPGKNPAYWPALRESLDLDMVKASHLPINLYTKDLEPSGDYYVIVPTVQEQEYLELLHKEWFPIEYNEEYYKSVTNGTFDSLIICYRQVQNCGLSDLCLKPDKNGNRFFRMFIDFWRPAPSLSEQDPIAGFISVAYNKIIADEDIIRLLAFEILHSLKTSFSYEVVETRVTDQYYALSHHNRDCLRRKAAYVVTVGVTSEFRGKGIAKFLLNKMKRRVMENRKAVSQGVSSIASFCIYT